MIEIHRAGSTLTLAGELTIYHAAEAKALLQDELRTDPALEVDLAGVEELDTAGAQLLLWLKQEGRAQGHPIPFLHHSAVVLDVIDQLNLAAAFGDTLLIAPSA